MFFETRRQVSRSKNFFAGAQVVGGKSEKSKINSRSLSGGVNLKLIPH